MKLALLLLALLTVSCGESPLLNHEMEKTFLAKNPSYAAAEHRFTKSNLSFTVDWDAPPKVGESKFLLRLWKTDSGTINGPYVNPKQNLHVFLWMPSMGHGSSPVKFKSLASGEYEVSNVYFIMGGKWEVKFQLLSSGKAVDEAVVTLSL